MSSTTAAVYISGQSFPAQTTHKKGSSAFLSSSIIAFPTKPRSRLVVVRRSTDSSPSAETPAATTQADEESDSSIEVPTAPPSLISALNVERALRGLPITDVDHYGRLGVQRGCSNDQVIIGYKNMVEELLNRGLDEEELSQRMEELKESYAILSSEEERRMYDWGLARTDNPDTYKWPFEVDKAKPPTEPPPQVMEPEDEGPTRLVGYFFLGWLILSFTLFIVLNR